MRKSLKNTLEKSENVSKITQIPNADPDGQRFCLRIQSLFSTLTWGLAEGPVKFRRLSDGDSNCQCGPIRDRVFEKNTG